MQLVFRKDILQRVTSVTVEEQYHYVTDELAMRCMYLADDCTVSNNQTESSECSRSLFQSWEFHLAASSQNIVRDKQVIGLVTTTWEWNIC